MVSKSEVLDTWTKAKKVISDIFSWWVIVLVLLVLGMFLFWLFWLNHISINQIGLAYNSWDGKVTVQDEPGWYRTSPFTFVAKLSTLPMKVQLQSNAAVINMKVVRFRKEGVEDYIRLQGFNWVVSDSELGNILMGYAYSNQEWSFLEIVQEGGPENFTNPSPDWVRTSGDGRRAEKKTGKHNEK